MDSEPDQPGAATRNDPATRALEALAEMQPQMRAAALFDGDDRTLAATGSDGWDDRALRVIRAVREADGAELASAHIAVNGGEVFLVAEGEYTLVATTERLVLASLFRFDGRMCLRDLGAELAAGKAGS